MKLNDEEYYSGRDALSYGCPITMVCGERSLGKTYYYKRHCIRHFIETGHTWYYMRRYDEQIKAICKKKEQFFSDVAAEFPRYDMRINGRVMQIKEKKVPDKPKSWKTMGYLIALSTYENEKSNQDASADMIVFDEFIKERKRVPYLENEVNAFYNLWETYDRRENRIRIVMLGNAADLTNPYFTEWGVVVTEEQPRFTRWNNRTVLLEYCRPSEAFVERSKQSNIYRVTQGSRYDEYARGNKFADLNDYFICPKPRGSHAQFCMVFQGHKFALYADWVGGIRWCTSKIPQGVKQTFVMTRSDMRPNYLMLQRAAVPLKLMGQAYRGGFLWFEDVRTREVVIRMLKLMGQVMDMA